MSYTQARSHVWNKNIMNNDGIIFWYFMYGLLLLGRACLNVWGFQRGDITRLGIIINGDCFVAYLIQYIALGIIYNYWVYIGAAIMSISSIILIWEQGRIGQAAALDINDTNDTNDINSLWLSS